MYYIPYYRVSTAKQGRSGLGLESQQSIVRKYIESSGGEILQEFTEIESGKSRTRIELLKAVELSKMKGAILIVAKLDRLARDAEFSFMIANRSYEIVCCDFPAGNKLMFGIMAVLAEYERGLISERTKNAWKMKFERGYVHKGGEFTTEVREASIQARKRKSISEDRYKQARAMAQAMKGSSLRKIADKLNELNYKTAQDKSFKPETIRRLLS